MDIPTALGPGLAGGEDGDPPKQGSEPALILYGRAVVEEGGSTSTSRGQGGACIHSLALCVGEFLAPVTGGGGAVAQAEGGVDSEGRVVVRIKGAGGGEGEAWWCRLGALGDR